MYRRARPHRSRWTRSTPCSGKTQTTSNPSEPSSATRQFGRRGAVGLLSAVWTAWPWGFCRAWLSMHFISCRCRPHFGSLLSAFFSFKRQPCSHVVRGHGGCQAGRRGARAPLARSGLAPDLHLSGRCGRARLRRGARALCRGCCWQGPGSARGGAAAA
jgi:hypothetical protein